MEATQAHVVTSFLPWLRDLPLACSREQMTPLPINIRDPLQDVKGTPQSYGGGTGPKSYSGGRVVRGHWALRNGPALLVRNPKVGWRVSQNLCPNPLPI